MICLDTNYLVCALEAGCCLATANREDFAAFLPHGLVLA